MSMSQISTFKPEQPWHNKHVVSPNCAYNIFLRSSEAKYNREQIRVDKEAKSLDRVFRQNIRKLNAAHRGIVSMMGHDPYPNCDRDHVLFEHNHPGFCYKRNGQPRRFHSLLESKTRKIIQDLEGKEGLLSKPASNVISDSPIMAEILSSPQIVEILCDLRTTAVFISDPRLFAQFSDTLMKSPSSPLPLNGQRPMECLKLYRTNLIQEFFEELRIQMGIRSTSGQSSDPLLNNYLNSDHGLDAGSRKVVVDKPIDEIFKHNDHSLLTDKQWNEAVIERLLQHVELKQDASKESKSDATKPSLLDAFRQFSLIVNAEDNLEVPSSKFLTVTPSSSVPPTNTVADFVAIQTATNLDTATDLEIKSSLLPRSRSRKSKRNEFDSFVKNLVTEVENISEIGKNMIQLQKKKPQQYDSVASPLVRLLRKKSLFSSLNEDDLLFYEYDGGRRDAENTLSRGLNINQPRPGGFTFRVPSRSEILGVATGAELDDLSFNVKRSKSASTNQGLSSRPTSKAGSIKSSKSKASVHSKFGTKSNTQQPVSTADINEKLNSVVDQCTCSHHYKRSLRRLCCPACNAKLRARCSDAQKRDRKVTEASESTWKMPGMSNFWPKNSHKDSKPHHLLSSIPLTLKKNYATHRSGYNLPTNEAGLELGSPLSYEPSSTNRSEQRLRGAPSPVGRRKNLLPEITRLMSTYVTGSKSNISDDNFAESPPTTINVINDNNLKVSATMNSFKNSAFQTPAWTIDRKSSNGLNNPRKYSGQSQRLRNNLEKSSRSIPNESKESMLNSWTLKVNRMDLMKLKHELEVENVRQKIVQFETDFLNSSDEIIRSQF